MDIELFEDQEIVYNTILERYEQGGIQRVQLLPGQTGWGKTHVATKLAYKLQMEYNKMAFIVCPATLKSHWKNIMNEHHIHCIIYSYSQIKGRRKHGKINHPYLTRGIESNGPFNSTSAFNELCVNGMFMIFDESHKLKNKTATHWACFELIQTALTLQNSQTNILHLSAACIDKKSCWSSLFRNLGLVTMKELYKYIPRQELEWEDYGLGALHKTALQYNASITEDIFSRNRVQTKSISTILEQLWSDLFKQYIVIDVDDPVYRDEHNVPYNYIQQNGFYTLDEDSVQVANGAIQLLRNAMIIRQEDDEININVDNANRNIELIQIALQELSSSKVKTLIRIVHDDIRNHDNSKIVLCVTFKRDQQYLKTILREYNPLVLNGDIPFKERDGVVNQFNAPNLNHRILIMTPQVGGTGVSLHDTDGRFPRRLYIIPSYHFLDIFQSAGRIYRRNMKSNAFVSFVYGNNSQAETIFVNTMIKSKIANSVSNSSRVFPDAYENYIEYNPNGMSNETINQLHAPVFNEIECLDNSMCVICLTNMKLKVELKCSHSYHKGCISSWVQYKQTCPMCRDQIT